MTGIQILVQNLLYDISQIAIPWDRVDEDYLAVPRRWDAKGSLVSQFAAKEGFIGANLQLELFRFILCLGPLSSTIDMCTYCLGW